MQNRRGLDVFFSPKSVAVVGATEKHEHVGRAILWNLIRSPFGGAVYPVNPKRSHVLGIRAYPSVGAVPDPVELAVLVTPAETVPGMIRECVEAGVSGAIIISAGFREAGAHGADLERQTLQEARRGNLRLIGPNCLGVMSPITGFNATFAPAIALPGNVALVSQSGAMCTAILDWSLRQKVGFSAFVSIGSMLDVNWGDLIDHLGADPHTRSIVIYMESIGDARSFLSAAREVALDKPVIVIKAGRSEATAQAAASHTGSLIGSDAVFEAAFRRVGVLRVTGISDVFSMTEVLARQPRPQGPRLSIVTNAGGPGVLAADALLAGGGALTPLSPDVMEQFNAILPPHWSHNNPIDVIGDAGPERFAQAVAIAAKDPHCDGLLAICAPQGLTHAADIAEKLKPFAQLPGKPILASWMGGAEAAEAEAVLHSVGIPTFPFPDDAVSAFLYMWRYSYNLRGLYETPAQTGAGDGAGKSAAAELLAGVRAAGRTLLSEAESKRLLTAYGIPAVDTRTAANLEEAVAHAAALGYPVAVKLHSFTLTHKTDVDGVWLNLHDARGVREAFAGIRQAVAEKAAPADFAGVSVQPMLPPGGYELIVGSSLDAQFGPVLLFGEGGALVEIHNDHALALPPLNTTLARRLMEQTRVFTALQGVRGRAPADIAALEQLLVRFSELVAENPCIREIDINPLYVSGARIVALDARVTLHAQDTDPALWPKPAIRPYPSRFTSSKSFAGGLEFRFRPIRPEDEPLVAAFHVTLSDRSVYLRYFHWMKLEQRTGHDRLTRICFIDYDRQMALVAEHRPPEDAPAQIVGIGRLVKSHTANEAELAVIVSDAFQRRGIGAELVRLLIDFARQERLERITATLLHENRPMRKVFERFGFTFQHTEDRDALEAILVLAAPERLHSTKGSASERPSLQSRMRHLPVSCLIAYLLASAAALCETIGSDRVKPVCGNPENGIAAGKPQLFDDRTLALLINSKAARLAELTASDPKAARTLSEQTQLTYEITNLRALSERSLSDRVLLKGGRSGRQGVARALAVLGFQVSLDPQRKQAGAVAEVEITVITKGDGQPSVVSLFPQEKTFNAALPDRDAGSLKDTDTVALERAAPTHEQVKGCTTAYRESERDVTFAWRFKPVFGKESVEPGVRQVYALLALPTGVDEEYLADVHVHTHWRLSKPAKRKSAGFLEESLRDELWTEAIRYNPAEMERALRPKLTAVRYVYGGKEDVNVDADGESFLPDTAIAIGGTQIEAPKLEVQSERRIRFAAPAQALVEHEAYISGRFGAPVPLLDPAVMALQPAAESGWGLKIEYARARPKDYDQSELRIKLKSRQRKKPLAELIVNHTLVEAGGRLYALQTADTDPTDSDALMLRFELPTAALRASPRVSVARLFAGEQFRDSAEAALEDDITASKVNLLAANSEEVTLAVAGTGFSPLAVLQIGGVTYTRWTNPALAINGTTSLELKLKWGALKGARQVTVSQGFAQPVILPLPDLEGNDAGGTEAARRKPRRHR